MNAIPLCDIIKAYIQIFTSIHNKYYLTQLYFARGYMFRLFIQPSSGQLTIEHNLFYVRSIWDPTVWDPILCAHKKVMFYCKLA